MTLLAFKWQQYTPDHWPTLTEWMNVRRTLYQHAIALLSRRESWNNSSHFIKKCIELSLEYRDRIDFPQSDLPQQFDQLFDEVAKKEALLELWNHKTGKHMLRHIFEACSPTKRKKLIKLLGSQEIQQWNFRRLQYFSSSILPPSEWNFE